MKKKILMVAVIATLSLWCAAAGRRFGLEAWKGAKVAFLGDSITDPCHVGCTQNYWNYLITDLGLDAKVYGVNGDTWKGVPKQVERMHAAGQDEVDAIFIFMGTNDYMGGVPLGEFFDLKDEETNLWGKMTTLKRRHFNRDLGTFKGRMNVALEKLKTEFPDAQVILMTPIHRAFFKCGERNVQPPECFPNARGNYVDEYVDAVKEAGRIWSCPVIDLYGESGLLPMNDSFVKYFSNEKADRLHPNDRGHRRLADLIEAKLNALPL